ncbi:MAG TPA: glycosyltransferase, partial [Planctomycetota bacterium]|nr:glycosyltransferase [Planctomycetota bacterium]
MTTTLRTLHVSLNPELGGGEKQVLALVEGSRKRGVDARLVALRDGPCFRAARERALPVEGIKPFFRYDPISIARLSRWIERDEPHVVHLHDGGAAAIGVSAANATGVPAIVHRRIASPFRRGWLSGWKRDPSRVARFIAVSEVVASVLREAGIPERAIAVVPSGIDVAALASTRPSPDLERLAPSSPRIATVAKLAPKKGVDVVLEAFARIAREIPEARLLVVGEGPEEAALRAKATGLGLEGRAVFTGSRSDVPAIVAGLDLFLFGSEREGSPGAVREAMALGVPVVAVAAPGTVEVLGDAGATVPIGDAAALADA